MLTFAINGNAVGGVSEFGEYYWVHIKYIELKIERGSNAPSTLQ